MADGKIVIDTALNNSGLTAGLDSLKKAVGKVGKTIGAAFAVQKIKAWSDAAQAAYVVQMQGEKKLATVMNQRLKATQAEYDSIMKLTAAEQQLGIIGDEVQLAGAQQLATFVTATGSLEKLIPAMNHLLAQQMGYNASAQDAVDKANMMGKVLQGEVGALKEVGISFSAAEEQVLRYADESERAAMLAQVIVNNVGEMNYALADTDYGRQIQFANALGDIKEQFGAIVNQVKAFFLPVLMAAADILARVASYARQLVQAFANLFHSPSKSGLSDKNDSLISSAGSAADAEKELAGAIGEAGDAAKGALAGFDELNVLQESVSGMDSAGTTLPSTGSIEWSDEVEVSPEVQAVFEKLKELLEPLMKIDLTPLKDSLIHLGEAMKPLTKALFSGLEWAWKNIFVPLAEWTIESALPAFLNDLAEATEKIGNWILQNPKAFTLLSGGFGALLGVLELSKLVEAAGGVAALAGSMSAFWWVLGGIAIVEIIAHWDEIIAKVRELKEEAEKLFQLFAGNDGIENGYEGAAESVENWTDEDTQFYLDKLAKSAGAAKDILYQLAESGRISKTQIFELWKQTGEGKLNGLTDENMQKAISNLEALYTDADSVNVNLTTLSNGSFKVTLDADGSAVTTAVETATAKVEGFNELEATAKLTVDAELKEKALPKVGWFTQLLEDIGIITIAYGDESTEGMDYNSSLSEESPVAQLERLWSPVPAWFQENVLAPLVKSMSEFWKDVGNAGKGALTIIQTEWAKLPNWFSTTVLAPLNVLTTEFWTSQKAAFDETWSVMSSAVPEHLNGWLSAFELFLNHIRSGINEIIDALNDIEIDEMGVHIGFNIPRLGNIALPRLAQGAVIPANREFLAVLGDQKNGRNLEAPEDLIRQIVREESGSQEINIRFSGSMAQLARVLKPVVEKETRRTGGSLVLGGGM